MIARRGRRAGAAPRPSRPAARSPIIAPRMLRISWPLAFVIAAAIAVVARRPRMLPWMVAAFAIWFVVETARTNRNRRP